MLVRVKEPRIRIEGDPVPERLISVVRELYGEVEVFKDDDEDLIEIKETRWSQLMDKLMHGGAIVRIRRENAGMTQSKLAERLGTSKSNISLMESGKRVIGRSMATRLAKIFPMEDPSDFMKVSTITPEEEEELRKMREE